MALSHTLTRRAKLFLLTKSRPTISSSSSSSFSWSSSLPLSSQTDVFSQRTIRHMSLMDSAVFSDSTAGPSSFFHFVDSTPEANTVVKELLQENDRNYDIFGKLRCQLLKIKLHDYYNHGACWADDLYALGAAPHLLREAWRHDIADLTSLSPTAGDHRVNQITLRSLPSTISSENWTECLGKKEAYSIYLEFFHAEIRRMGVRKAVDMYVLSEEANGGLQNCKGKGPRMLARLLDGAIHPFIHLGFGLEFGDVVVAAEGLAAAAVHHADAFDPLYPPAWPHASLPTTNTTNAQCQPSALSLYAQLSSEPLFHPGPYKRNQLFDTRLSFALSDGRAEGLQKLVGEWDLSVDELENEQGWRKRVEEIGWLVSLLACGTHVEGNRKPAIDFFLMHTLTSSIFLPAYMKNITPTQRKIILESFLLAVFHMALSRGRPQLNIPWIVQRSATPKYDQSSSSGSKTKGKISRFDGINDPNREDFGSPWVTIVENSIGAYDSHVPKAIRALMYWDQQLSSTQTGSVLGIKAINEQGSQLIPCGSQLDGSLFIRAAGVVMDVMGWIKDGDREGSWAFDPLGFPEAWR